MDSRESTWLFVTDHRGGRLFHVRVTARKLPRLEEVEEFETTWVEPEHSPPTSLGPQRESVSSREEVESRTRTRGCAREISHWIQEHVHTFPIPRRVLVCAPDRLFGDLRADLLRTILREDLEMKQVELARFSASRLAGHPVVRQWACEREEASPFMA